MLRSRIIPVLLMRQSGLVKTRQFKEEKYVGDPINAVKVFNEKEVDELCIYDIDATVLRKEPDYDHLRSIAAQSRMPLCFGGGVTSAQQASRLLSLGYEKISVSSAAVARPDLVREMADAVGTQSVVVTLDVRKGGLHKKYSVFTHNGRRAVKENLGELVQRFEQLGAGEIVINSIDRDGAMRGYDLDLARMIRDRISLPLTIVGGAGKTADMRDLIDTIGTCGAAAGSMFVFTGPYRAVLISYHRP